MGNLLNSVFLTQKTVELRSTSGDGAGKMTDGNTVQIAPTLQPAFLEVSERVKDDGCHERMTITLGSLRKECRVRVGAWRRVLFL